MPEPTSSAATLKSVMLILASASPRRHELLAQAGLTFTAVAAGINEDLLPNEAAAAYVQRLAEEKAQAVWNAHSSADTSDDPLSFLAPTPASSATATSWASPPILPMRAGCWSC